MAGVVKLWMGAGWALGVFGGGRKEVRNMWPDIRACIHGDSQRAQARVPVPHKPGPSLCLRASHLDEIRIRQL